MQQFLVELSSSLHHARSVLSATLLLYTTDHRMQSRMQHPQRPTQSQSAFAYHDKYLLCRSADPLLGFLWFVGVRYTEPHSMLLVGSATAALIDGVQRLFLAAP